MFHAIREFFLGLRLRRALAEHAKRPGETETVRLARILLKLSRVDEARTTVQTGLSSFPASRRLQDLREEVRRCHASKMLSHLGEILEDDPSADDYIRASELSRAIGELEQAFSYAYEGMHAFPGDWRIHLSLGKLYFHRYNSTRESSDGDECLKHLHEARELAPEEPKVLFFLALGHAIQGEQREALAVVEFLLARHPDHPKAVDLKRRIRAAIAAGAGSGTRDGTREASDSATADALASVGVDYSTVQQKLAEVSELIAWFFIDEDGSVISSHTEPDTLFDLQDPASGLQALAASCKFGSGRIGIGELVSLSLSGDGWHIHLRALGPLSLVAFLKGAVSASTVESLIGGIVEAVPAACEA